MMKNALTFQSTTLTMHDNHWLASSDIAKALGYSRADAVTKIYDRNKDEFSADMSQTPKMGVSGNYQKTVRMFSLRGAHLIAMFAKTPVAKDFRKWVLNILDDITDSRTVHVKAHRRKLPNMRNHPSLEDFRSLPEVDAAWRNYEVIKRTHEDFKDQAKALSSEASHAGLMGEIYASGLYAYWANTAYFCALQQYEQRLARYKQCFDAVTRSIQYAAE